MPVGAVVEMRFTSGSAARAPEVLRDVLRATRGFPGCRGVEVLFDSADPTHAFVLETWDSAEADAAYRAWRASPDGAARALGEILSAPPTVCTGLLS